MKPVIVFDMNETLLDMAALDPTFARIFDGADGAALRTEWFAQLLALFLTATVIDEYRRFDELTGDALAMLAARHGATLDDADRAAFKEALGRIPAYADVRPGLERLAAAGFTVATLTNSTRESAVRLLEQAGIRELFAHVLSADEVQRYKPAREAYAHAAAEIGVELDRIVLVAAHAWDVAGAMAAGCTAAFVDRPGKTPDPGAPAPQLRARDVDELARQLVARHA